MDGMSIVKSLQDKKVLWRGPYEGRKLDKPVEAKLYFTRQRIFVCQNYLEGCDCGATHRLPYRNSFVYDYDITTLQHPSQIALITNCILINNKKFSI
jgi:hypothetical protein